ncbi:MAG TPA: VCBS repeat-containing protein, partial [Planctomycetota bacterium]|nr:VCBS repeat-containing protein [Planctomycetota bacterium]
MRAPVRAVVAGALLAVLLGGGVWILARHRVRPAPAPGTPPGPGSSPGARPTALAPPIETLIEARCGGCHPPVNPGVLARADWARAMTYMRRVLRLKAGLTLPEEEWDRIWRYYRRLSPEALPRLGPDPSDSPIRFERQAIGRPPGEVSRIAHVQAVDLFGEGHPGLLVCDAEAGDILFLRRSPEGRWEETVLAHTGPAAHAEVFDYNGDGLLDIVVAVLGSTTQTDEKCGKVVLLLNRGGGRFEAKTLLEGVGRVADVRPADFNGDGAVDFVVAVFGLLKEGKIGWLEHRPGDTFVFHTLLEKPGAIHVPVADLNGDGSPDFVALISQDSEEILAFLNDGKGNFETHSIFRAGTPVYGSSGIQLVDLNGDGRPDILYTNGDGFDLPQPDLSTPLRPYQGIQWLENRGGLQFVYHDILRFYGSYA